MSTKTLCTSWQGERACLDRKNGTASRLCGGFAQNRRTAGLRDEGLLESALARPQNRHVYEAATDIRQLAAIYAVGILRNHPFTDGNKRAAFIALGMFLHENGLRLTADPLEAGNTFFDAAAGQLDEEALVAWISRHSVLS